MNKWNLSSLGILNLSMQSIKNSPYLINFAERQRNPIRGQTNFQKRWNLLEE